MKKILMLLAAAVTLSGVSAFTARAQENSAVDETDMLRREIKALSRMVDDYEYAFDRMEKKMADIQWYDVVGDIAYIDKVRLAGPPRHKTRPTGNAFDDKFLANERLFHAYVFIPKSVIENRKYPLIVFPHGGIHGTFDITNYHIVREWLAQGYIVIAPDYRGSTGYGKKAHLEIDYGGLENEDVLISRDYMVENYAIVDPQRVGIAGWSHGGMIALMNILRYPDSYACAFAGVPVSDVAFRLSYKRPSYTAEFTPDYHVGATPAEAPEEYARRSPVTYAGLLRKPLYINTNTKDDDVGSDEVQRMIDALLAEGKEFEYDVHDWLEGSHVFDRIDTRQATELRMKVHEFLNKHLNPPKPFKTHGDLRRAGYRFAGGSDSGAKK